MNELSRRGKKGKDSPVAEGAKLFKLGSLVLDSLFQVGQMLLLAISESALSSSILNLAFAGEINLAVAR